MGKQTAKAAKAANDISDDINDLMGVIDNEYATIVENGIAAGDTDKWVSTGSYALNALLSGSIYKGLPGNKVTAYAGEPSTGKTFYAIQAVKHFLEDNLDGMVFYFETESAISRAMMVERGVDVTRVINVPVATIQEFRTQAIKLLDAYMEKPESKRRPLVLCLDSLGNLSTTKEVEDISAGKDTRDMTRAQLIRGAFRVLTLKLGKAGVPLLVTNHVYDVIGQMFPMKKMGGGSGLEYAASSIIFFTKSKDKDTSDPMQVNGAIVKALLKKSRLTIENKRVSTLLNYQNGLDQYYGLVDLAVKFGIWTKVPQYIVTDDGKFGQKAIYKDPEKHFTKEILDRIDEACAGEFLYGKTNVTDIDAIEPELEEENV
jgi:RecA/RadA recombinase